MVPCFTPSSTVMLDVFPTGVSTLIFEVWFISYKLLISTWAICLVIHSWYIIFQPQFIKTFFDISKKWKCFIFILPLIYLLLLSSVWVGFLLLIFLLFLLFVFVTCSHFCFHFAFFNAISYKNVFTRSTPLWLSWMFLRIRLFVYFPLLPITTVLVFDFLFWSC